MPYIPHTEKEIKEMLQSIGVESVDDLFRVVPKDLIINGPLNLPPGLSEQELVAEMKKVASKNATTDNRISFLGAGAYNHYIPSVVSHTVLRSEFYTSYTPYQPEISQGTLQAIFEYQTLLCRLTGMDVANASMYEGASATAEAILMARRINSRKKVVISSSLHPEYMEVVKTYLGTQPVLIKEVMHCMDTGTTLPDAVEKHVDEQTSCIVVQQPNFFGSLEDLKALGEIALKKGALFIVTTTEPISLGLLKPPGEFGADIVVGEGQGLGNALSFGGPYLGFFATCEKYLRQMPGRLVGETVDKDGKRGCVLTLSTREQHIRREKATSNICTNEGLCALAATVYLCAFGKKGLMELAKLNFSKAEYLKKALQGARGVKLAFNAPTFNEFVIEVNKDPDELLNALSDKGIWGGISLKRFYRHLERHILLCATEMNTKEDMDKLVDAIGSRMG